MCRSWSPVTLNAFQPQLQRSTRLSSPLLSSGAFRIVRTATNSPFSIEHGHRKDKTSKQDFFLFLGFFHINVSSFHTFFSPYSYFWVHLVTLVCVSISKRVDRLHLGSPDVHPNLAFFFFFLFFAFCRQTSKNWLLWLAALFSFNSKFLILFLSYVFFLPSLSIFLGKSASFSHDRSSVSIFHSRTQTTSRLVRFEQRTKSASQKRTDSLFAFVFCLVHSHSFELGPSPHFFFVHCVCVCAHDHFCFS